MHLTSTAPLCLFRTALSIQGQEKSDKKGAGLSQTRRRLSVVSDNKLVEGLAGLQTDDNGAATDLAAQSTCVTSYAGVSKKGYAP